MRAVVTGGTGFVGSHLVNALVARGDNVRCVVRSPARAAHLTELGVDLLVGSLDDDRTLLAAVDGADVVFHVAGLIKALEPVEYRRVNVDGTRRIASACLAAVHPPRRFVLVSSQAAAGPALRSRPAREADPPRPVSAYGRSKAEAELAAMAVADRIEVAIVRPPTVYGPRDEALEPLFKLASYGLAPGLPSNPAISLVHVRDLVRALLLAADHPKAVGRTFFAAAPPLDFVEIVDLLGLAFDRQLRRIPVPAVVLVAAGIGADLLSRATRTPRPFGRQKALEMLHSGWVCSTELAERELGFRAEVPFSDGFRETADWYRRERWR
jgi:nucleoside-diphosphate-sugar epimerase